MLRATDRLNVDLRLKENAAEKEKEKARKRGSKRRKKCEDEPEDNGFHFVAYAASHGHVWRMDGLEREPHSISGVGTDQVGASNDMGEIAESQAWQQAVSTDIKRQLEAEEVNQMEFSVMRLVPTSGPSVASLHEDQMKRQREDWAPFLQHLVLLHASKGDLRDRLKRIAS